MGHLKKAFTAVTATVVLAAAAHAAPPQAPQNPSTPEGTIFSGDFLSGQGDPIGDALAAAGVSPAANSRFVDSDNVCRVVTSNAEGKVISTGSPISEKSANDWAAYSNKQYGAEGLKSVVKCSPPPAPKAPGK